MEERILIGDDEERKLIDSSNIPTFHASLTEHASKSHTPVFRGRA
jgi:hypothetical protein